MIYSNEDKTKILVEGEDIKDMLRTIRDIEYFEGYLKASVLRNSLDENNIEVLSVMSKNTKKSIGEYQKFPECAKILLQSNISRLEKVFEIMNSYKKASEIFEESKKLFYS